ncbi:hypothetical protein ACFSO7_04095 [Bacillus sp. CGMCC 1.16607]|uniref:hypothetical protein n=1 Tax=Bacillus sp. CGMCC 1.16607 TaxID=3351842 RepID=UPI00363EF6C4
MRLLILLTSFILICMEPRETVSEAIWSNESAITFIKNVEITKKNGTYVVMADVRPKLGVFYYVLEDGHNEWIAETKVKVRKMSSEWERINIELIFPKNKFQDKLPMILYLYEKDEKGEILHPTAKKIS